MAIVHLFEIKMHKDIYNVSISAFAIFASLLLNVQIALFGIFQREKKLQDIIDPQDKRDYEFIKIKKDLFSELNTNISYLIIVCCLCVMLFLMLYIIDTRKNIEIYLSFYFYSHFILTLLMIIKRTYAVFQREYEN